MLVKVNQTSVKTGDEYNLFIMSDLHVGSNAVDYERMEADLKYAEENDCEIAILGDIFDNVVPRDPKKGSLDGLHPRLRQSDTVMMEALTWAHEILEPYKHRIVLMAVGNHDDWSIKTAGIDLVSILLDRLGKHDVYGSIAGWYVRRFESGERNSCSVKLRYHHGAGGAAPTTKGMTDFYRMRSWIEGADIIAMGHKHNRFVDLAQSEYISRHDVPQTRTTVCAMPGSYMRHANTDGSRHYAENWNCGPQPMGGIHIHATLDNQALKSSKVNLNVRLPLL